jgi:hypothetical protein
MEKYNQFVEFMDNLSKNKATLTAKLADAQDRVTTFSRELDNAKVMVETCISKLGQLKVQLKESPTDVTLGAENAIWKTRLKDYGERQEMLAVALLAAQEKYELLILQNKDLDYTPYAESATAEMNAEIKRLYKELCKSIDDTAEARDTYLKAIGKMNRIKSAGRNTCEAGQKAASYSKINKIENSAEHFSINTGQFVVSENDVTKA